MPKKNKVPGIKAYVSKGIAYAYDRITGTRLTPPHAMYSEEWFAALNAARAKVKPIQEKPGTWGGLVVLYRESARFQDLAPRTKEDYLKVLDWTKPLHSMPLDKWTRGFVAGLRDKAKLKKGRRFANYVLSVVSVVFEVGLEREFVGLDINPAAKMKKIRKPKTEPRANRPWTPEEWDAVLEAVPAHLKAPILLGGILGYRQGEILAAPLGSYNAKTGMLTRISAKSGKEVKVKAPKAVAEALSALPAHKDKTLFVNTRGKAWTEDGFRSVFFKVIRKLEAEGKVDSGLTFHGLRHTAATKMRQLGFDTRTIADMLGQETEGMASHYSRQADLVPKLQGVVEKLDQETEEKDAKSLEKIENS
ncbi:integrase [Microvirga lupini]|uniref:Integrase n=1 Tax=Microvirga lupini TaxID=420324 RepID=A0A7W4YY34_9HYPH|nr:tyrosine-type recombinase/integrase [Microvirga lupini]MBB3020706.1 integrase [Microvirga lupini]